CQDRVRLENSWMGSILTLSRSHEKTRRSGFFHAGGEPRLFLGSVVFRRAGNLFANGLAGAAHAVGRLVAGGFNSVAGLGCGMLGGVGGLLGRALGGVPGLLGA